MEVCLKSHWDMRNEIWAHLLPEPASTEEAGFGFAKFSLQGNNCQFKLHDWIAFDDSDFICKEGDYLHLTDEARIRVIKHAHSTDTCLVEFHSHPFPFPAKFSYADKIGLDQLVPHLWWRLKHRPFLAVVVAPDDFDGIAWIESPQMPVPLKSMDDGQCVIEATGCSIGLWS